MGFFKNVGKSFRKPLPALASVFKDIPIVGDFLGAGAQQQATDDANAFNVRQAREQMAFSAAESQKSMDFSERMSSTAMQRYKADALAAGFNPLLGFTGGGSSSPGGSMGSAAGFSAEAVPVSAVMSSAMERTRLKSEMESQKYTRWRDAALAQNTRQDTQNKSDEGVGIRLRNERDEMLNTFYRKHPTVFGLNQASPTVGAGGSAAKSLMPLLLKLFLKK